MREQALTIVAPEGSPDHRAVTKIITGHLSPAGPDWHYVPVRVPEGVGELAIRCHYDRSAADLDVGLFDPRGHGPGVQEGFRGWSGRDGREVVVSECHATRGYLPGPIHAGSWHVLLSPYRLASGGVDWRLEVTMRPGSDGDPFVARPASLETGYRTPGWYRGDLHTHTVYSDGRYLPEQIAEGAVEAGLDFVASTEHNTPAAHAVWGHFERPDLLVLNGQEVTTRCGHFNAIGLEAGSWVDWRYRPEDGRLAGVLESFRQRGGMMVVNHPFGPHPGDQWGFGYDGVDAVEVWNGATHRAANEAALAVWDGLLGAGRRLAATGGSDAHASPDPVGFPQTVVWAERLAVADVLAGLRAGRCYLARSAEVQVELVASTSSHRAGLGESLPGEPGESALVELLVRGAPGTLATLHTQEGTVRRTTVPGDEAAVRFRTRLGGTRYVRAEVRRPDGEPVALTNPIWLDREPTVTG